RTRWLYHLHGWARAAAVIFDNRSSRLHVSRPLLWRFAGEQQSLLRSLRSGWWRSVRKLWPRWHLVSPQCWGVLRRESIPTLDPSHGVSEFLRVTLGCILGIRFGYSRLRSRAFLQGPLNGLVDRTQKAIHLVDPFCHDADETTTISAV